MYLSDHQACIISSTSERSSSCVLQACSKTKYAKFNTEHQFSHSRPNEEHQHSKQHTDLMFWRVSLLLLFACVKWVKTLKLTKLKIFLYAMMMALRRLVKTSIKWNHWFPRKKGAKALINKIYIRIFCLSMKVIKGGSSPSGVIVPGQVRTQHTTPDVKSLFVV